MLQLDQKQHQQQRDDENQYDNLDEDEDENWEGKVVDENCDNSPLVLLCGGKIYRDKKIDYVTKVELDRIADGLTAKEGNWMLDDDDDKAIAATAGIAATDADSNADAEEESRSEPCTTKRISMYQLFWSNHRTVLIGNYSYEVLETAFATRNISLQFVGNANNRTEMFHMTKPEETKTDLLLIGFVVNCAKISTISILRRWLVGRSSGRHWFSITRLRRGRSTRIIESSNNVLLQDCKIIDSQTREEDVSYDTNEWYIVDSCQREVCHIQQEELVELLLQIKTDGGLILKALMADVVPF